MKEASLRPVVGALIQVRVDSSRVPRKALLPLGDTSCVGQVVRRVQRASRVDRIVVCTSTEAQDAPLLPIAAAHGVEVYQGCKDDCLERFRSCARDRGIDVIVRACGDSPLVSPAVIDAAVAHLLNNRTDYVFVRDLPVGTYVEVFTYAALERACYAAVDRSVSDDLTHFLRRPEINDVQSIVAPAALRRPDLVLALNRPEDLVVLRQIFDFAPTNESCVSLRDAIAYCDANPDLVAINSRYVPTPTRCDTRLEPARVPSRPAQLQWYEGVESHADRSRVR